MDHMRTSGTEPSPVILSQRKQFKQLNMYAQKCQNKAKPKGKVQQTHIITIWINFKHTEKLMLSKR